MWVLTNLAKKYDEDSDSDRKPGYARRLCIFLQEEITSKDQK